MAYDNPVLKEEIEEEEAIETIKVQPSLLRRISWSDVIAGVVAALFTQVVLSILGVAFGIIAIDPMDARMRLPAALSTGAGIWWIVTGLLSVIAGGVVASNGTLRRRFLARLGVVAVASGGPS